MPEPSATDVLAEIMAVQAGYGVRFRHERDDVPVHECRGLFDTFIERADAVLRMMMNEGFAVCPIAGVDGQNGRPFLEHPSGSTMGFDLNPTRKPDYRTPRYWGEPVADQCAAQ